MSSHRSKSKQKYERFGDVQRLVERLAVETPASGQYLYDYKLEQARKQSTSMESDEFHRKYKINFNDLPISAQTLNGLQQRDFTKMTEIQRCVIPHALAGRDVMAASRTGSGKTLAYLVPLVEKLYRNKFIPLDGLGAIVLVPVRELAMQVFEVLNSFTRNMELSVGMVIGGKDVQYEKQKIQNMNVLVCTPGRLLHHMEDTYGFETSNLQMLVLDEADEMLQLGFRETLDAILKGLPPRQTMLFSATLTKTIHTLASLSLNEPERIFLHTANSAEESVSTANLASIYETPLKLAQYYLVVDENAKLNTLYSFIKEHPKKKILVFLSTCKQVRFVYEAFKTFKFGCPLYELQGRQKQTKRMAIFYTFCQKQYGVLFCTNIASRGLDFPKIDWVVQVDIPEDVETYVHRVGRTARFRSEGRALTLVLPSEERFVEALKEKKISVNKISQNPQRYYTIDNSLEARCSENQQLKYLAQRALISYLKFVFKAENKKVFNVHKINVAELALSWGLSNPPVINFKKKQPKQQGDGQQSEEQQQQDSPKLTKIQKLRLKMKQKKQQRQNQLVKQAEQSENATKEAKQANNEQSDDQLLKFKGKHVATQTKLVPSVSKRQLKKIKPQGHFEGRNKILFDEEGNPTTQAEQTKRTFQSNRLKNIDASERLRERIELNRDMDLQTQKERRKHRRLKKKLRERQDREAQLDQEDAGIELDVQSD